MLWFLTQMFVLVLVVAAAAGYYSWYLWPKFQKVGATRAEVDAERGKNQNLEDRARKAEAEAKAVAAELAALKSSSVPRAELDAAKKQAADEAAKAESFNVQLKKARELQIAAEGRNTENSKATQTKIFNLENELAGLREQAARDRKAAEQALEEVQRAKSTIPGKPEEMEALEKELMQSRRAFTASENAANAASNERDKANSDAAKLRDKIKVLEGELAIARGNAKPGAAGPENDASSLRVALAAAESKAAEALRSVSIARDEAFALRAKVGLLETELADARSDIQAPATEADIEVVRHSLHVSQAEADEAKKAHAAAAAQVVVHRTEISALKAQLDKLHALHGTTHVEAPNIATSPSAPPAEAPAPAPEVVEAPAPEVAEAPAAEAPPAAV